MKLCLKVPMQPASVHYSPLTPHLKSCTWPHAHVSLLHHVGYILAISIDSFMLALDSRESVRVSSAAHTEHFHTSSFDQNR